MSSAGPHALQRLQNCSSSVSGLDMCFPGLRANDAQGAGDVVNQTSGLEAHLDEQTLHHGPLFRPIAF